MALRGWECSTRSLWRRTRDGALCYGDAGGFRDPQTETWSTAGQRLGWEAEIRGIAAGLYFEHDAGRQRLFLDLSRYEEVAVVVAGGGFEGYAAPAGIHRKQPLKTLPRALDYRADGYRDHTANVDYEGSDWLDVLDRERYAQTRLRIWRQATGDETPPPA